MTIRLINLQCLELYLLLEHGFPKGLATALLWAPSPLCISRSIPFSTSSMHVTEIADDIHVTTNQRVILRKWTVETGNGKEFNISWGCHSRQLIDLFLRMRLSIIRIQALPLQPLFVSMKLQLSFCKINWEE